MVTVTAPARTVQPVHAKTASVSLVRVRELPLLADIGINPDEIGRRQPLMITVEARMAASQIVAIDQTLDYRRIVRMAEELAGRHIPLIETFAQTLGDSLMACEGVIAVCVDIDKPFALERGMAGVSYRCGDMA